MSCNTQKACESVSMCLKTEMFTDTMIEGLNTDQNKYEILAMVSSHYVGTLRSSLKK